MGGGGGVKTIERGLKEHKRSRHSSHHNRNRISSLHFYLLPYNCCITVLSLSKNKTKTKQKRVCVCVGGGVLSRKFNHVLYCRIKVTFLLTVYVFEPGAHGPVGRAFEI